MAVRIGTTESLSESTQTSSTPSDKVNHSVTDPVSSDSFIAFFSCDVAVSNVATRSKVDFKVDGSIVATFSPRMRNAAEYHNVFFFQQITSKSSTFAVEIEYSSTDGVNTAKIKNARVTVWKYSAMSGLDLHYGYSDSDDALGAAFADGASTSFEPTSTGNYFVIGCAGLDPGSTTVSSSVRLDVNATYYPYQSGTYEYFSTLAPTVATGAYRCASMMTRQSLSSGASRTVRMQARNTSGSLGTWRYSRILAFREDAFTTDADFVSADTAAEDTNTTATYETRATNTTSTPAATSDYLVLANMYNSQTYVSPEIEYSEGAISVAGSVVQSQYTFNNITTGDYDYFAIGHASYKSTGAAFTTLTEHRLQGDVTDDTSLAKSSYIIILLIPTGETLSQANSVKADIRYTTMSSDYLSVSFGAPPVSRDSSVKANISPAYANSAVGNISNTMTSSNSVIANLVHAVYSRSGTESSLPTTNANLSTIYTNTEITNVALDDATRVEMEGTGYVIHQFKNKNTNNTSPIIVRWNGQSSVAPSSKAVTLQIYDNEGASWEDVDTDNETGADTDFDLQGTISVDLDHYYDSGYWVTCRVYQVI